MTTLNTNIRLYTTEPHKCSYLEDRVATTLFVDPHAEINQHTYSRLSEHGFRRSGRHLYRPDCSNCNACVPARVKVAQFRPNRQQKRTIKANQDLTTSYTSDIDTPEHYELYERYIRLRHRDGDMYPPSLDQYRSFLTSEWGLTRYIELSKDGQLVCVAVVDAMDNGLSAVYTFFEPELHSRSLGTFAVLCQIQMARELGLGYVYLGYWIEQCSKMSYKTRFKPLEVLIDDDWQPLEALSTP
jgi:arginine-tRNA-protein transferase